MPPEFDLCNNTDSETKQYSHWYHAKPDKQPPARLVYKYIVGFYCSAQYFLNHKSHIQVLHPCDQKLCDFLWNMSHLYYTLSSFDKPVIFNITSKKHTLNQLIHFALNEWNKCQWWYEAQFCIATKKNYKHPFINPPGNIKNSQTTALTRSKIFTTRSRAMLTTAILLLMYKRTIYYTWTFFPNNMTSIMFFHSPSIYA